MESTPNRTIGSSVKFEIDDLPFNNWNLVNSLYPETRKNSLQTKFWKSNSGFDFLGPLSSFFADLFTFVLTAENQISKSGEKPDRNSSRISLSQNEVNLLPS